ncbi:hypothetical protein [Vibrio vulnificus]|uniref:hypothetical protein n=1 Tax=Vibrio vulnificus TaxID=672 RepID=UPI001559D66B|nr:hypothetical protein [Vibrio vulnificus]MDS1769828.1 hypothetical protein [Vibrio vulnificus]MDS1851495.1 hypothetical protein [Vibrio vulnificus]HAS6320440.1 hypothetical protein [Vibrio vulnificus]HDY7591576.1 hypothetical protein [Vibrio vulnificus]
MIKPSLRFDVRARLPYDFLSAFIGLEPRFLLSAPLSCHWCSCYRFPYHQLSSHPFFDNPFFYNPFFDNPFILLAIRALKIRGTPKAFDTNVSLSTLLFLIDVSFSTHFKRRNGVLLMVCLLIYLNII